MLLLMADNRTQYTQ